jgi:DNA-directed RNA polymerase specialized sigma24 family protein
MSSQLQDEQRDLVRRVHRVVHWLKRSFGYTGSKQTADFGGIIFAKLAHNQTTGPLLASDPTKLRGVVKTVASRTLIDEMRKRAATGGFVTSPHALPELPEREQWTPSIHRLTSDRERTEMVRDELRRFLAGDGSEKIRPRSRPQMATAFELFYFQDHSQAQIAEKLDVSRNTVMEWIDCMTLHIGRRIAERESGGGPGRPPH